jgi:hypothetical protein
MAAKESEVSDTSSASAGISPKKEGAMSPGEAIAEFRAPICEVVRTRKATGTKAAISFAARFFGLSERRIRAAWHNEVRSVPAHELDQVRIAHRRHVMERRAALLAEIVQLERTLQELGDDAP